MFFILFFILCSLYFVSSDSETSFPPATLYSYKVRKLDKSEEGLVVTAKASHIRRTKGVYTREKNRLILKQFTEQKHKVWVVKVSLMFVSTVILQINEAF